jgi:hypothetical protein
MQKLVLVALATFSTAATAGYHYAPEVYAGWSRFRRVTYSWGYGSLAGAAASADENQYIDCSTSKFVYEGSTDTTYGYCVAVDKDWNSGGCYTNDPEMVAVIQSINAASNVSFNATDGVCTYVAVANGSFSL